MCVCVFVKRMLVCQQCDSLCVTACKPNDGPCETETCRAVEGHGMLVRVTEQGTALPLH